MLTGGRNLRPIVVSPVPHIPFLSQRGRLIPGKQSALEAKIIYRGGRHTHLQRLSRTGASMRAVCQGASSDTDCTRFVLKCRSRISRRLHGPLVILSPCRNHLLSSVCSSIAAFGTHPQRLLHMRRYCFFDMPLNRTDGRYLLHVCKFVCMPIGGTKWALGEVDDVEVEKAEASARPGSQHRLLLQPQSQPCRDVLAKTYRREPFKANSYNSSRRRFRETGGSLSCSLVVNADSLVD